MTAQELTALIDTVYDAVDKSKAGPIKLGEQMGQVVYNGLALQVVQVVLSQVVPKGQQPVRHSQEPTKEAWQETEE